MFRTLILSTMVFLAVGLIPAVSALPGADPSTTPEPGGSCAEASAPIALPMTNGRIHRLLLRLDEGLQGSDGQWVFTLGERQGRLITDERANRMRVIVPVVPTADMPPELLLRMLQANFESALDARYAIAGEVVWATFIHPLRELDEGELLSGIAQTFTLAETFGSSFSSGLLQFGGGDHANELYESFERKGV